MPPIKNVNVVWLDQVSKVSLQRVKLCMSTLHGLDDHPLLSEDLSYGNISKENKDKKEKDDVLE